MWHRLFALVGIQALLVAGCTEVPDPGGSEDPGALDVVGRRVPVEQVQVYGDFAVDQLGGPEAFARTWWAMDRGYTASQIIDGPGVPERDGTLLGVEPVNEPLGLLGATPVALPRDFTLAMALPVGAEPHASAGSFDGDSDAQKQYLEFVEMTMVELYEAAEQHARDGAEEPGPTIRARTTVVASILLLNRGYSPEQVIEALALGTMTFTSRRLGCVAINGELAQGRDRYAEDCGDLPTPFGEPGTAPDGAAAEQPDDGATDLDPDGETGATDVWDGSFRGQVDESLIVEIADPDDAAVLAVNQVATDILDGRAAVTIRIELDGAGVGTDCDTDVVRVFESTTPAALDEDGTAVVGGTITVTASGTRPVVAGADCSGIDGVAYEGPVSFLVEAVSADRVDVTLRNQDGQPVYTVETRRE